MSKSFFHYVLCALLMPDVMPRVRGEMENSRTKTIEKLWLEFEEWAPGEWDPSDGNSDVKVILTDGSNWVATFFTYSNIETLRKKNAESGECLAGVYFWATDLILIDKLTRSRIKEVIDHLIDEEEFETIFVRVKPDEE
jgi:hypothetical protein